MEDLCSICMCNGRKLYFIGGTGFYILYTQILNEIPVYDLSQMPVRICWECRTLLFRFHKFKSQVKHSYMCLLKHSKELTTPKPSQPHLQIQLVTQITYPELKVKTEKEEEVTKDPEDSEVTTDQGHVQLQVQVEGEAEVKSEQEPEHCEPETFVNNLELERPKRKRAAKVLRNEKTNKEKSKKKLKETKKSKFKKKPKVESKKRRVSTDTSVSDVSFGQSVTSDTREEVTNSQTDVTNIQTDEIVKDNVSLEAVPKVNGEVDKAPRKVKQSSKDELPEKPQCVECGKMFSSRKTYRYHLNVLHKGQNRYPCPRCGKVYQWKSNLGRHMRSHKARDSGELYCETCDKRFASVATYRQHLRVSRRHVSESEFSFMCNECGKKFVSKTRLRDHIDWEHLNNIKFRCQLCNKPFKCHTSLYVHMQNVHRNKEKKDNLCHVCGKSYQNAAKLKYHIVAMHTSETPYQCTQCTAAFGWYSSLYRHVREVHYKMKVQPKKTKKVKKLGSEILPSLVPQPPLLNMQPGPP